MAEWEEIAYDQLPVWVKEASKPPRKVKESYTKFFNGKHYRYQVRYDVFDGELEIFYWVKPVEDTQPVPSKKIEWVTYTNEADRFSIRKPSDWLVKIRGETEKADGITMMPERVYICPPTQKGHVIIVGAVTESYIPVMSDPEFYKGIVSGLESKTVSVKEDLAPYTINGNPARRVSTYAHFGGEQIAGDAYVISHGDEYYCLWYVAAKGSTRDESATATEIMKSLVTL